MQRRPRAVPREPTTEQLNALTEVQLRQALADAGIPTTPTQTRDELATAYQQAIRTARQAHEQRLLTTTFTEAELHALTTDDLEFIIRYRYDPRPERLKAGRIQQILRLQAGPPPRIPQFQWEGLPVAPRTEGPPARQTLTDLVRTGLLETLRTRLQEPNIPQNELDEALKEAGHLFDETRALLLLDDGRANPGYDNSDVFRWAVYRGMLNVVRRLLADPRVDPTANNNEAWKDANRTEFLGLQPNTQFHNYSAIRELLANDPRVQASVGLEKTLTTLQELQERLRRPLLPNKPVTLRNGPTTEEITLDPQDLAGYVRTHVAPRPGGQPFNIPDWFLLSGETATLQEVLRALGYGPLLPIFGGWVDAPIQLVLWTYLYDSPVKLTPQLVQQVAALSPEQQLQLLGNYQGPGDPASLAYALLTLHQPPAYTWDPSTLQRYVEISQYPSHIVYRLAKYLYGYTGGEQSTESPYRRIARLPPSPLDPYIIQYNDQPDTMAQYIGMTFPSGVTDKETYYFENLRHYLNVVQRNVQTLQPPPVLVNVPPTNQAAVLEPYTDAELIDAYEVQPGTWTNRPTLIRRIIDEAGTTGARWHFRKRNCSNDLDDQRNINILSGEPRVKNDPTNPIISYGTYSNYRCYNMDELEANFRFADEDTKDEFRFRPPDFVKGDEMVDFPDDSIRQLQTLLTEIPNAIYRPLLEKIQQGLNYKNEAARLLGQKRREYLALPPEQQALVQTYLAWLFTLGMTMRFWKGPGHPYPHLWVEGGGGAERCEAPTRDANVVRKFGERTGLLNQMPKPLETWVLALPRVTYNFKTGQATTGKETIDYIVQEAQRGEFCMADASDRLTQTSYYLATQILGLDNTAFNQLITNYLTALMKTPIRQPPFQPTEVGKTGHTDPWHKLVDLPTVQATPTRPPTTGLPVAPRRRTQGQLVDTGVVTGMQPRQLFDAPEQPMLMRLTNGEPIRPRPLFDAAGPQQAGVVAIVPPDVNMETTFNLPRAALTGELENMLNLAPQPDARNRRRGTRRGGHRRNQ